jgi:hypothetical protein
MMHWVEDAIPTARREIAVGLDKYGHPGRAPSLLRV